jgi:CBS domain-containing membrane protein
MKVSEIKYNHHYSNGQHGKHWSVRQIIEDACENDSETEQIVYKTIVGKGRRKTASCTRAEFAQWAVYEVVRNENSWHVKLQE